MEQPVRPRGLKKKKKDSKLDPYKTVAGLMAPVRDLQLRGFDGTAMRNEVRRRNEHYEGVRPPYRSAKTAPAICRYEMPSGKQA